MQDFTINVPKIKFKIQFDTETKDKSSIVSFPPGAEVVMQIAGMLLSQGFLEELAETTSAELAKGDDPALQLDYDKMLDCIALLKTLTSASLDALIENYIDLQAEEVEHGEETA